MQSFPSARAEYAAPGGVLLLVLLTGGCLPAAPADADDAGEAVVRHLGAGIGAAPPRGPWEVICLSRQGGARQEADATFLRRFDDLPAPVLPGRACTAASDDRFDWTVDGTGEIAFQVMLGKARRERGGGIVVQAGTSSGTIDYTAYECTVLRQDGGWAVEACVVTVTT